MLLADNGADVIRIERPAGDPFAAQLGLQGLAARQAQRRARPEDTRLTATLPRPRRRGPTSWSSRFSPGTTARLGIDHAHAVADEPAADHCSITGYGRGNRHTDRPGYDALVAARTGLFFDQKGRRGAAMEYIARAARTRTPSSRAPGRVVQRRGPARARCSRVRRGRASGAAFLATLGISAALRAREMTGRGQWVETSLLQGALAAVALNWQRVEKPGRCRCTGCGRSTRARSRGCSSAPTGGGCTTGRSARTGSCSVSQGDELTVPDARPQVPRRP